MIAEMVLGAPAALFLQVDDLYDDFLALCEANKRPLRPLEDSMLVKNPEYQGETPPAGPQQAVLAGNRDKGTVKDKFNPEGVHKVDLVWQLAAKDSAGKRFTIVQRCNATWGTEKMPSSLRKAIEMVRGGQTITDDEVKDGLELDSFTGKNALLLLVHNPGQGGKVFANVKLVMPYTGTTPIEPEQIGDGSPADRQTAYAERAQAAAQEALRNVARREQSEKVDPAEAAL